MNNVLNLTFYKGEDLYSDGEIEENLLEVVKTYDEYEEFLMEQSDWTYLYHLSPIRENLLEWFEFGEKSSLLEIGSGCGALTGLFCSKCQQVTGIDLSKRRSEINSYKNKAFSNLEIYVGNFLDINIETKYDYVTLIGVLEYSIYYVGGDDPFVSMLQKAREYLKPGGKLIIAIENKYGLKYWSGAREDHTGKFFDGISGYNSVERVNTFSKNKLEQLISKAGFTESEFFYPFPDYKMPSEVFSSKRLPSYGSLRNVTNVYDRDRYAFFNEEEVFDSLCKDELIELFVNSFLVFCQ